MRGDTQSSLPMETLETQRLANVRNKEKLLAELNLNSAIVPSIYKKQDKDARRPPTKKRKIDVNETPARSSARIASAGSRPSYKEDDGERYNYIDGLEKGKSRQSKFGKKEQTIENDLRTLIPVADAESIQEGWSQWKASAKGPARNDVGCFHFEDYPTFRPNKSPEEMIREGSFGGSYWRPLKSRKLGIVIKDDWKELPEAWISGLDVSKYLANPNYDPDVNKFKVSCGQSIEEWEAAGWIAHEYDVRGWFQWYCRFFQGRRCDDDDRQVSRWRKCVGETGRWKRMLLKKYLRMGVKDVFDDGEEEESIEVSPVMHQTCHHWAYEIRQHDLDAAWKKPS